MAAVAPVESFANQGNGNGWPFRVLRGSVSAPVYVPAKFPCQLADYAFSQISFFSNTLHLCVSAVCSSENLTSSTHFSFVIR